MAFSSGRVTFCRFRIEGNGPLAVDQALIDRLAEFKFRETAIGTPDEIEVGWTTGEHIFDTQFTYEKNGYGDMLLFAMRMDTNKVPAEVKRAYKVMNEQAMAADNPSGFASKSQKREAGDLAARQASEDLASGKFRRSKLVPILWDLRRGMLYVGALGNTINEKVASLFRQTFELSLEPVSAGSLAGHIMSGKGRTRDYEDVRPSPFTGPPPQATRDMDDADGPTDLTIPSVPWTKASFELKDFVGNEMLMWLWWRCEEHEGLIESKGAAGEVELAMVMNKSLEMDCAWDATGKQTLRADAPTRLPEAAEALLEGKWPRKAGLILSGDSHPYDLTLQADRWHITAAQLPDAEDAQSPREIIEHRLMSTRALADHLDALLAAFLDVRFSDRWPNLRNSITDWIHTRRKPRGASSPSRQPTPVA